MNYSFKNPFELSNTAGKKDKAQSVNVTAPTNEVLEDVSFIEGEFMRAMFEMQKSNPTAKAQEATGSSDDITAPIVFLTLVSGKADIVKCVQALKRIFTKTAKITTADGSVMAFKEILFDKIDYNETKSLLGEYIKSFLLTALNI